MQEIFTIIVIHEIQNALTDYKKEVEKKIDKIKSEEPKRTEL